MGRAWNCALRQTINQWRRWLTLTGWFWFFLVLAATPAAFGTLPALSIHSSGNQSILVSWTNTATGFVLEQTDFLSGVTLWKPITQPPAEANTSSASL